MKAMTAERCSGIKSGYWSAEKKEDLVQQLGLYEHQILSPEKIERFQKLRTRLKGAREIVRQPCLWRGLRLLPLIRNLPMICTPVRVQIGAERSARCRNRRRTIAGV